MAELDDIRQRLEWFDQERRNSNRKLAEMERKLEQYQFDLDTRDKKIGELEERLQEAQGSITPATDLDQRFTTLRRDLLDRINQTSSGRTDSTLDLNQMRRTESKGVARDIAAIQKQLPQVARLQEELSRRRDEETRLLHMINGVQARFKGLDDQLDSAINGSAYHSESIKRLITQIQELEVKVSDVGRANRQTASRIDGAMTAATRNETNINQMDGTYRDMIEQLKSWLDKIRLAEFERDQRVTGWQQAFAEYKDDQVRFQQQWGIVHDQHRQAKLMLGNIERWQTQVETQMKETSELNRVNSDQQQKRWEAFLLDYERSKQNTTVDIDQRNVSIDRRQRDMEEKFHELETLVTELRRDVNTLYRVHSYHADSMKRLAAFWGDDVEKAIENDPSRRRSPTPTPIPDELIQ